MFGNNVHKCTSDGKYFLTQDWELSILISITWAAVMAWHANERIYVVIR